MKTVKDTLGIKYDKYAEIYNMNNEDLGLLLKYIMWSFGEDVILQDVKPIAKKRIIQYSEDLESQVEEKLNDFAFEKVFNSLTQQVSKSHRSWQILRDNIDNAKKEKDGNGNNPTTTPVVNVPESPTEKAEKTEPDFWVQGNDIAFDPKAAELIQSLGYTLDDVAKYIEENASELILPFEPLSIEEVINRMETV